MRRGRCQIWRVICKNSAAKLRAARITCQPLIESTTWNFSKIASTLMKLSACSPDNAKLWRIATPNES